MKDAKEVFGNSSFLMPGGGICGVAHPALARPLIEMGVCVTHVGGVSVGALNSAGLAQAQSQEELPRYLDEEDAVYDYIHEIGARVVFPFSVGNVHLWRTRAWLSHKPLFGLLRNIDPKKLFSSPITLDWPVMNDTTKLHELYSNRSPQFKEDPRLETYNPSRAAAMQEEDIPVIMRMIAASAAIKPLYDPIKIGRDYYSDGGSIAGLVMKAINAGCDTIFVLFPYPKVYYPRGSQDDFVSRYIPWFKDFLASYSAELRARDHDEIERVTPYNQRIRHEAEIAHLRETKDGILGIWKARLSRLLTRLKQVRIIPLYAEPPETFDLKSFKKGDFDIVRRRAREMVPRIIEPFLK